MSGCALPLFDGMLQALEDCVNTAGSVGVLHMALHSNQPGLVLGWQSSLKTLLDTGTRQMRNSCSVVISYQTFALAANNVHSSTV